MCQPQVPCGMVAAEVFKNASITVTPVTQETDVKSVLTKVELGEVDAGVVYVTDVKAAGSKVKGIKIPPATTPPPTYPIATSPRAATPRRAGVRDLRAVPDGPEGAQGRRLRESLTSRRCRDGRRG